ncbi:hypothetical protein F2Q70_00011586 [Brassica cretica]|uniref:Uncharacterized protein n=1 Tax=Brassica cretica TaxID=69181 RepID=A0A8S9M7L3_BRACR|nr:hypothetical protein F2Q70_00011586 [Brassica cretica]
MSSSSCVSGNSYRRRLNAERGMPKHGGVVNPVTFLHLELRQIQEDCTIAAEKDIIRFVLVLISHVEDKKSLISGMNKDISEFRLNVDRLEKEIEVMKTASEGKGEECMSQGRCLRNVVVCGVGMSLLCYYYFFV